MQTFHSLLQTLPDWCFPLGYFCVFLGWLLGRPATTKVVNKASSWVVGFGNVTITTNQVAGSTGSDDAPHEDSALSRAGSWASLVGLALTLGPLLKDWFK